MASTRKAFERQFAELLPKQGAWGIEEESDYQILIQTGYRVWSGKGRTHIGGKGPVIVDAPTEFLRPHKHHVPSESEKQAAANLAAKFPYCMGISGDKCMDGDGKVIKLETEQPDPESSRSETDAGPSRSSPSK